MPTRHSQQGFSLIELLVSLTILLLASSGLASLMVQNSRINKSQQMTAEIQANARNCLEMIVAQLRSAGWDPMATGLPVVALDPDPDAISSIEVFADLNDSGAIDAAGEQVLIRHIDDRVEWRLDGDTSTPFVVLAVNISNDADGDGTVEPMFVADSTADPTRITVQITAQSPVIDPVTREFLRYTVRSDVVLRKTL